MNGKTKSFNENNMASIITHSLVGLSAALMMPKDWRTSTFLTFATIAPSLPDLDVLGFYAGIDYVSFFGHRGFFHSFFFAFVLGSCLVMLLCRIEAKMQAISWGKLSLFFGLIISSHGILDAMTTGGRGIALFSPFNNARIFLPFRVIQVSPMHISQFFGEWGWAVLKSEMLWVWLPLALILIFKKRRDIFQKSTSPL